LTFAWTHCVLRAIGDLTRATLAKILCYMEDVTNEEDYFFHQKTT